METLHELGHTAVFGRKLDGGHGSSGVNVDNVNKIRRQLGSQFGQRVVYGQRVLRADPNNEYFAFSKRALIQ